MNKLVLTTLFISLSLSLTSYSQILGRFYYNKNWELTKKENAVYFRVSIFDTTNYFFAGQVRDFAKSGKLLMTGTYKDGIKQGTFTFYHPDGKVESEGDYLDNKRVNTWKYYYPDGTPKQEVVFLPKGFEIKFFNDSTGKEQLRDGTGHWKEYYEEYRSPELIVNEGTFVENIKDGRWTCMLQSGKMIFIEDYKKGNLSSQWEFRDGKKQKSEFLVSPSENVLLEHFKFSLMETFSTDSTVRKQDYPFLFKPQTVVYEVSASPKGGMQAFYRQVGEILRYPPAARSKGIAGKVFVEFVVREDGVLIDFKVIKGIGGGCDEAAIRAIKATPPWNPATRKGVPVSQRYTLPIIFEVSR